MRRMTTTLWLALLLAASSGVAQTIPVEIEAGYRWLSLSGNENMYRTQINERSGFLLRSLTYTTNDFGHDSNFADRLRIDASDLSVGPAGSLRIDLEKSSLYKFTLNYRQTDNFSALPEFANPLIGQGVIPGQHTWDRQRKMIDADFEFRKWSAITPFAGFSWNRYSGPGTTTYHVGQDEFLLDQSLSNRDQEFRAGFGFNYKNFFGQVTQGWRNFRENETLNLAPGAGSGNTLTPILGTDITASSINRIDHTSGHTPFTDFYVTGQFSRARVIGNYTRFAADSSGSENEDAMGSFASFSISRFFTGLNDNIEARAKNTTWRGGARAEVPIVNDVDFLASFQREHRALEGSALIDTLYLASLPFSGTGTAIDMTTVLNASSALERDEDLLEAAVSARALGPFAIRAGVSQSRQDVTVSPDLSEIVVAGPSQGGKFNRRVNSLDASATWASHGFSLGAAWRHDNADDPILRTDFLTRNRYRARAGWSDAAKQYIVSVVGEQSDPKNDRPDIGYDAKIRSLTADVEAGITETVRLHAEASRFRTTSSILYRRPENFTIDTSFNRESGNSYGGGFMLAFAPATFDASFLRFDNSGNNPLTLDRLRARGTFKVHGNTGITAEFDRDRYTEDARFGNYTGNRYGLFLRWIQ